MSQKENKEAVYKDQPLILLRKHDVLYPFLRLMFYMCTFVLAWVVMHQLPLSAHRSQKVPLDASKLELQIRGC